MPCANRVATLRQVGQAPQPQTLGVWLCLGWQGCANRHQGRVTCCKTLTQFQRWGQGHQSAWVSCTLNLGVLCGGLLGARWLGEAPWAKLPGVVVGYWPQYPTR